MKEVTVRIHKVMALSAALHHHPALMEEYSQAFSKLALWFPISTDQYEWNFEGRNVSPLSSPFLRSN